MAENQVETLEQKLHHYRRNRDQLLQDLSSMWVDPKAPAVSGLIVLLPIAVTLYVLYWFFQKISLIPGLTVLDLTAYPLLNAAIKTFMGIVVIFLLVTVIGRFVRTETGYRLERLLDRGVEQLPIIRFIYSLTKVTTDTLLTGTEEFRTPVKLDFHGVRVTGFKTGNTAADGRPIIFIPTAPNITTGFVAEVDHDALIETDETVEEALKSILSAGLATPANDVDTAAGGTAHPGSR